DVPLYGHWQTEPYRPPPAVNGVIPRNPEYGTVDLWNGDRNLLPAGTVYLNPQEGASHVAAAARALGVDCAPAKVGFAFKSGRGVPQMQGFVVCQEHAVAVMAAAEALAEDARGKAQARREKAVLKRWKRLLQHLLKRMRLRQQYGH
ncbi:hypothetical protein JKP88DRAFT_143231, partial [Tribonema minus]